MRKRSSTRSQDSLATEGLVPGVGPVPCPGMLVGEAPGYNEHVAHRPFVGKAGGVLTAYCKGANLARSELFVTNIYPFWTGAGNPDPTGEQIAAEEWRLERDIARVKPRVIAAIGRIATRWFLGDVDLETAHGIPNTSDRAPGAIVVACYHPASGFYDPELAAFAQDDLLRFSYFLHNPVEVKKKPRFKIRLRARPRVEYVGGFLDTEGLPTGLGPWGFSWSKDGRESEVVIYREGWKPPRVRGLVTFHNALHDLVVLRAMGIDTNEIEVGDTMVRAYNLRLEPQALKALSFRHLGLKMREFDEEVRPHFDKLAIRWLRKAVKAEYPKPESIAVADLAKKKHREYKPQGAGRRIANLIRSYEKDPTTKLDKRWEKIGETQWVDLTADYQRQATAVVGEAFPDFSIFCVPKKKAVRYSGLDAIATALVEPKLKRLVDEKGLAGVYEMDRRALRFVDRMQEVGLRVDVDRLFTLEADLEEMREERARDVRRVVGDRWFNPGSSDQGAKWLYSGKGLPVLRYTDSGRGSTSDESLWMLRGYHADDPDVRAFLEAEQEYREADKCLGTFVRPIIHFMRRDAIGDWRLHPRFRVTRVISGRNSSHDPNVLAFPTRTKLGKRIRACFVARDGFILLSCDASQIELRVMADHSRDPRMRRAFENGEDLHALTTTLIFHLALEEVSKWPEKRYVSKTINFAVMYGISARALLEQLYKAGIFDFTLTDCERFIREWFVAYSSVRRYLEALWKQAEVDGFVRDMWGRICYVPNLRVLDGPLREAAQRLAGNMPIQGGAHGLVKRAEIRLLDWIEENGLREEVLPWLQIHDELLIEVKEGEVGRMARVVEEIMTADQAKVSVPIVANSKWGRSWGELKSGVDK